MRRNQITIQNRKSKIQNRKSKILWPAFTAVILVAFFFRFYRLADHPLGLFFDPAINGLDAVRLMQRGGPVIFFPTNGGREALFMYLLIPFIRLFDTTPFSLRALTATLSLLTVALLFGFLYDAPKFLRVPGIRGSRVRLCFATLGGLTLAVSYWHIAVSRLGQRPILVPLLSVPIFWFFLKGWAGGRKRWFILSGLLMGLAGYTYSAARLLPLILVLALLPEFFRPSSQGRLRQKRLWPDLSLFLLAALLIYSPLAWYLLNHPAQFTARAGSVMVWTFLDRPADIAAELARNAIRVGAFFCCAGSPNVIFGPPGYPGSALVLLPFLLVGLAAAARQWRHLFLRLLLVWWVVGIAPSMLAIEAPHPWRMIVAVIPTAGLIAYGLLAAIAWFENRFRWPRPALYLLASFLILLPTPAMFRAYFFEWTDLQATRGAYDYGAVAIRDAVLDHTAEAIPLYLPLSRLNDSTLLYYLSGSFNRQAALAVPPAEEAIVISPDQNAPDSTWVRLADQTTTILPPLTAEGQSLIRQALAGRAATPIRTPAGETAARLAHLAADPARFVQQPALPLDGTFAPFELIGATYSQTIEQTQASLPATLYWRATQSTPTEYEILLRLVDDQRRVWGNGDARPTGWVYPTSFWRPGLDAIAAQHHILVEPEEPLPPGRYWLAVSLFDPAKQQRLPLTGGTGDSPDTIFVGPLKVPLPPPSTPPTLTAIEATFGNVVRLTGFGLERSAIAAGQPLDLTLGWEALARPPVDYTVFVHLLDAGGNLVAGHDSQPVEGTYPTTIWSPGEQILDHHTLPTPDNLSPGRYRLAIGLYHQPSGERLPLSPPGSDGRFILPPIITVEGRP